MSLEYIKEILIPLAAVIFSWPTVVLLLVILFRNGITDLLGILTNKLQTGSIKKAQIGGTSLEFYAPQTLETVIGKTNISAVPSPFTCDSYVFRSARYGFEISFPLGGGWIPNFDEAGDLEQPLQQQGQVVVAQIVSANEVGGLKPNINVLIQPVGDKTISEYLADSVREFIALHCTILSYKVDKATNGASFSYLLPLTIDDEQTVVLHCIARATLLNGLAFLATTTILNGVELPQKIRTQLNSMLNSFEVISTPATDQSISEK